MTQNVLSDYLAEIARVHATRAGTNEMSYYPALSGALNAIGASLKPKVFCVSNLANKGAGFPDLGLFAGTHRTPPDAWPTGRPPERGVVEVDDIPADLSIKRNSAQVRQNYLPHYGLVLITNYREFELLGRDAQGQIEIREKFSFDCKTDAEFLALARGTRRPPGLAARFAEFLQRVLLHNAPLSKPEDVAFFLASYARDALARVEEHAALPAFQDLRSALEQALGMQFLDTKGEHLFRSTLVQTLFYGLFSAWVEVARTGGVFDWRAASWSLHIPFVDTLFQRIATPQHLQPLGLSEPLTWASEALNRVDRDAFFQRFQEDEAVRYFYEPFLAAFDPKLRKELGVWYTPREIVRYMVERVDHVLRTELNVADGLADPNVWVLDPCCGTGAYLTEVLNRIERTLRDKGEDALVAAELKQAAVTRVTGFEIMPAPYVIAHWQVGHALRSAGAPLNTGERAAVYLTNALTGWAAPSAEPSGPATQQGWRFTYPPLALESDEATKVKRERPILVVLGNPPYNAFAGTAPAEEQGLVDAYKVGLREDWGIKKYNLDDLYVRFFRIAERRIAEGTGKGVVCFITNHSWLWYPSYVVMRKRLIAEFDRIWVDNLNGSKFETGKIAPDGSPDPSVFSTDSNREGIQVGTAIGLLVRTAHQTPRSHFFREVWGTNKRTELIKNLSVSTFDNLYDHPVPTTAQRFSFRPASMSVAYEGWPSIVLLAASPSIPGLAEMRRGTLLGEDPSDLANRIGMFLDQNNSIELLRSQNVGPAFDMARYDAARARLSLAKSEGFNAARIRRYQLRPFDQTWCYHTAARPLWNEPRPELARLVGNNNPALVSRAYRERPNEGPHLLLTSSLPDYHLLRPNCSAITVFDAENRANLSPAARAWLHALGLPDPDTDRDTAFLPWHHALAIGYAPAWLSENADGIRQDWPRVPLPGNADLLRASAALGARVAALLDPEAPVPGVTTGTIDPALRLIGAPARQDGGQITEADTNLTAGWGHAGKDNAVMPGRGRAVERDFTPREAATQAAFPDERTHDIYLNDAVFWRNVPDSVWDFTIGGYQVIKKWLSYRERPLLGRPLSIGEVRHVTGVARRLAALRIMEPELDANYRACAAAHRPLPTP